MSNTKQKHVLVSVQTHQLLTMLKSQLGVRTLEDVIISHLELSENYEKVKQVLSESAQNLEL